MTKIYFASPLSQKWNQPLTKYSLKKIRNQFPGVEVYLPQEQMAINDKSSYADSTMIAQYDTDALLESDLMIAVLDGATIDVGVASEIGVAYHADMPILGLYTDSRQQGADNPQKIRGFTRSGGVSIQLCKPLYSRTCEASRGDCFQQTE